MSRRKKALIQPPYVSFPDLQSELVRDSWVTPDTYTNVFASVGPDPAVYLFMMVDRNEYDRALVAYVGMSKNLAQRVSGHEVRAELDASDHWIMTWFKPTEAAALRETETSYIRKFDPPWNIVGRKRGLDLSEMRGHP